MAEITRNRNGHTRSVKCSHFRIFSVVNRPYLVSQTIPYNVLSQRFLAKPTPRNTTRDAFMNKYICVRELIFRLFRDVNLRRLCSNSLIASATTTSRNLTPAPRGCKIACKSVYFSTTARRVTSPTWGPPPPCKQALKKGEIAMYKIKSRPRLITKQAKSKRKRKLNTIGWNLRLILSIRA